MEAMAQTVPGTGATRAVRVANMSARREDRATAMREIIAGSRFDVLAVDLLSDAAMARLAAEVAAGEPGYEHTFLTQLEHALDVVVERGVSIVTNSGALDPEALAAKVAELAAARGTELPVAWQDAGSLTVAQLAAIGGDQEYPAGLSTEPVAATIAYGAFGIAHALREGARVVITGRVSREALVVGAAIAHHGWTRDQLDPLAGAVAVGHVLSGGPGATGTSRGSTDQTRSSGDPVAGGYPLAEIAVDGSAVITRHPGAMGSVTVGTVTDQLLDGVGGARYPAPDVVLRIDSLRLVQEGFDRVVLSGARGEFPPEAQAVVLVWDEGDHERRQLRWLSRELSAVVIQSDQGTATTVPGPLRTAPVGSGSVDDALTYHPPVDTTAPGGVTRHSALGALAGVRVGALGSGFNIALWVWDDAAFAWLREAFDIPALEAALPAVAGAVTHRYVLQNLRCVNVVVDAARARLDGESMATLGHTLRSAQVAVPSEMLEVSP